MSVTVRLPETFSDTFPERQLVIEEKVQTLGQLVERLEASLDGFDRSEEEIYNFAVNGNLILHGESGTPIRDGDQVEMMIVFAGG